jgi:hypothetical protein
MAKQDNLKQGEVAKQVERQKRGAFGTPGENQSIDRGQFRVGGTARILIDGSGGIVINGTLTGGGTFTWTGTANFNGTNNLNGTINLVGPTTATGSVVVNGPMDINGVWRLLGTGTISGDVTQTGTFTVNSPGKIVVAGSAPITIGQNGGFPAVAFPNGRLTSIAGQVGLIDNANNSAVVIGTNSARLTVGTKGVAVDAAGTTVMEKVFMPGLPTRSVAGVTANFVRIDPVTFEVYRTV